jgi:hypothetical protein
MGYLERRGESTQAHLMAGWKMAKRDDPTTKPERRKTEKKNRGGTSSGESGAHF